MNAKQRRERKKNRREKKGGRGNCKCEGTFLRWGGEEENEEKNTESGGRGKWRKEKRGDGLREWEESYERYLRKMRGK